MKMKYNTISVSLENEIARVYLNRPEKSNALNIEVIRELNDAFTQIDKDSSVRFIIISSESSNFCSGADLKWMLGAKELTKEQNYQECMEMAGLYSTIYNSQKIILASVAGACIGGGIGLVAASDFCIASDNSYFQFGEVKLGLIPATISPYVIQRIGYQNTKKLMLTGELYLAEQALEMGLIDYIAAPLQLNRTVDHLIANLRQAGRESISKTKALLNHLGPIQIDAQLKQLTAEMIASARVSDEGMKGIEAFLDKRKPKW
jgi:methylglutaconyl-CoA hydratase